MGIPAAVATRASACFAALPGAAEESLSIRLAETVRERELAYRLVYREYTRKGFADPNAYKLFTYRYHLLPGTATLLAADGQRVLATLTSVEDSAFQLPAERVFGDLLAPLRREGRRLVEFGGLAIRAGEEGTALANLKRMRLLFQLFRTAAQYALRMQGASDIIIAIPPCYRALYRYLCFEELGDVRYYGSYNTPALALRLPLDRVLTLKAGGFLSFFFQNKLPAHLRRRPSPLSEEDLDELFSVRSDLLERLTREELLLLQEAFPDVGESVRSVLARRGDRRLTGALP